MNEEQKDIFGNLVPVNESEQALVASLIEGLSNVRSSIASGGPLSSEPFLGVGKDGSWKYGQEGTKVAPASRWIPNLPKMQHGWIAWKDSKPAGLLLVSVGEKLPEPSSLRDVGAPWEQVYSMQVRCIEGPDEGAQALFQNSSLGAKRAIDGLITAITTQVSKTKVPAIPVLRLDIRSYANKKYGGTTYEPVFAVTGWVNPITGKAIGDSSESAPRAAPSQPTSVEEILTEAVSAGNAGRRRRVGA